MPIIRRSLNYEGHFTQIPNAWLRDQRLSLRAKGLLGQLLTHSQGWSVSIKSLAQKNGCGRDAIRSAVRELEECGYLTRQQERQAGGEFGETVWFTSEPMTDLPMTEKPTTVNPTPKNNNSKNNNSKHLPIDDAFEEFWEIYPRKVGKSAAKRALAVVSRETSLDDILAGARRIANDPNLPPKSFIPYPATWLNRSGWEDEPYPVRGESEPKKPNAEVPGKNDWKLFYHRDGDHAFCNPGDFDH
jgi:hypothetical protein